MRTRTRTRTRIIVNIGSFVPEAKQRLAPRPNGVSIYVYVDAHEMMSMSGAWASVPQKPVMHTHHTAPHRTASRRPAVHLPAPKATRPTSSLVAA